MTDDTDNTNERYPESDEEPGPLDGMVPLLREADVSHKEKAIALLGAARTEYRYAVEDGQIERPDFSRIPEVSGFLSWARDILPALDEVLEKFEE